MKNTQPSFELILEESITRSAKDNYLSKRERKEISRALRNVNIAPEEIIDFGFYVADRIYVESDRRVADWLRDFVDFARVANAPVGFLLQGVWFSPGSEIRAVLLNSLHEAQDAIDLSIFNFTDSKLANGILKAIERGVNVTLVTDAGWKRNINTKIPLLCSTGAMVLVANGSERDLMHHKYAIFDKRYVLSGSYNWTTSARSNYENLVLVNRREQVLRFVANFERLVASSVQLGV